MAVAVAGAAEAEGRGGAEGGDGSGGGEGSRSRGSPPAPLRSAPGRAPEPRSPHSCLQIPTPRPSAPQTPTPRARYADPRRVDSHPSEQAADRVTTGPQLPAGTGDAYGGGNVEGAWPGRKVRAVTGRPLLSLPPHRLWGSAASFLGAS